MGQPGFNETISELSTNEINKKIRDMYALRRECYQQISLFKRIIEDTGKIVDVCERELRERGHL